MSKQREREQQLAAEIVELQSRLHRLDQQRRRLESKLDVLDRFIRCFALKALGDTPETANFISELDSEYLDNWVHVDPQPNVSSLRPLNTPRDPNFPTIANHSGFLGYSRVFSGSLGFSRVFWGPTIQLSTTFTASSGANL